MLEIRNFQGKFTPLTIPITKSNPQFIFGIKFQTHISPINPLMSFHPQQKNFTQPALNAHTKKVTFKAEC